MPWQDLDLPPGHPGSDEAIARVLAEKPAHWLAYWEGRFNNREGGGARLDLQTLTHDMIREINAKTHVMNELIDEAVGRVLAHLESKGWTDGTDVFFSTDHGDLAGDYGLIYKGPFHTDSLMRLPLIWRPAPTAGVAAAEVDDPVGQLDLAATFCEIAGVPVADWIEGTPLPTADGEPGRERVLCEWDSQQPSIGMHMRSIYRDGWLCTAYEPSTGGRPTGLEKSPLIRPDQLERFLTPIEIQYDGTEGELYNVHEDPHQWRNLWADPDYASIRSDLVRDLYDSLPKTFNRLEVAAPA